MVRQRLDGNRTTLYYLNPQIMPVEQPYADKRGGVSSVRFHGPRLTTSDHCRHVHIELVETSVA